MFAATFTLPASPPTVMTDLATQAGTLLTQQISSQAPSGLRPVISYCFPAAADPTSG